MEAYVDISEIGQMKRVYRWDNTADEQKWHESVRERNHSANPYFISVNRKGGDKVCVFFLRRMMRPIAFAFQL
jgi:hypothetical protein